MAKLTRTELENHLWKSADILRGSIDSSDYKIYIFGFLFLKRLSDRFEEEAKESIRQGLPENVAYSDPDEHEFFLVERALVVDQKADDGYWRPPQQSMRRD